MGESSVPHLGVPLGFPMASPFPVSVDSLVIFLPAREIVMVGIRRDGDTNGGVLLRAGVPHMEAD
jgi:hypothetical protein